jgi:hypothetical protein
MKIIFFDLLFHHFIITLKRTNKKGAFYFIFSNLETFDRLLFPRPLDGVVVLIFLAIAGMKKGHIGGCITGIVSSLYRVVYYLVHNNTHKREFGVWPAVFFFPQMSLRVYLSMRCVCVFSHLEFSLFFSTLPPNGMPSIAVAHFPPIFLFRCF